ncbi:MAG: hypothetical protein GX275_02575 [Clostridiales bacterium]|nr:hypothetical protein [Clostridiales bacterium]
MKVNYYNKLIESINSNDTKVTTKNTKKNKFDIVLKDKIDNNKNVVISKSTNIKNNKVESKEDQNVDEADECNSDSTESIDTLIQLLSNLVKDINDVISNSSINTDNLKNELQNLLSEINGKLSAFDEVINDTQDQNKNVIDSFLDLFDTNNLDEIKNIITNNVDNVEITEINKELQNTVDLLKADTNSEKVLTNENVESKLDELTNLLKKINSKISNTNDNEKNNAITTSKVITDNVEENEVIVSKESNSEEAPEEKNNFSKSIEKEEKILKNILNDGDNVSSKFTLINNNVNKAENITEVHSINRQTMAEDIVKNIKYMSNNGIKELMVRINPKELGEMVIKIIQEEGTTRAELKASSKDTYNLISQNLENIKKYLGEQNIKIQNVDISLYEDTTFFKDQTSSNNPFKGSEEDRKNATESSRISEISTDEILEEEEEISNINMLA